MASWSQWTTWTTCPPSNCRDALGGIRVRNRTCGGSPSCNTGESSQEEPCSFYPCADYFAIITSDEMVTYMHNPYEMTLNDQSEQFQVNELPEGNYFGIFTFVIGDELFYLYSDTNDKPGKKYNFKTSTWTDLGKTNISNDAVWIEAKDNQMMFIGGRPNYPNSQPRTKKTSFYDPMTDTVSDGPDLPNACVYPAVARISPNEIFIATGYICTDTNIYNEDTKTYMSRKSLSQWIFGAAAGMVKAINGDRKVILAGGAYGGTIQDHVQIYDIKTNTWTFQTFKIPQKIVFAPTFVVNNKLLLLGGELTGNVYVDEVVEVSDTGYKTLSKPMVAALRPQRYLRFPKATPTK